MKQIYILLFFVLSSSFLLAQEIIQNKKRYVGVIDSIGDTLIPFRYTKIEDSPFLVDKYNEGITSPADKDKLYTIYDGKRKGLYSLKRGELIPPIYERIDYLYDNGFRVEGYLVYNYGKKGFYHPTGKEIAPCEFDIIECINYNSDYFKTMIGQKGGKWYSWKYDQWEQEIFSPIDYSIGYEFIMGLSGFVRDYITYDVYDVEAKNKIQTNIKEPIDEKNEFYTLFAIDGKCGVRLKSGKLLVEPVYDLVQFETENPHTVIVAKSGILYKIDLRTNVKSLIINDQY